MAWALFGLAWKAFPLFQLFRKVSSTWARVVPRRWALCATKTPALCRKRRYASGTQVFPRWWSSVQTTVAGTPNAQATKEWHQSLRSGKCLSAR